MSQQTKTTNLNPPSTIIYSIQCGISSFIATSISTTLFHPLQLIKVRLQSHDGQSNQQNLVPKYKGIINALKQIIKEQGFQGLYKGVGVSIFSAATAFSLFFSIYQSRKKSLLQNVNKDYQMMQILRAGIQAGVYVTLMTQPLWVIKTRMLLNTQKHFKQTKNTFETIKQINRQHGFTGFYKGLAMNLILTANGAINMFFYQGSKKLYQKLQIPQTQLMQKNFICGGLAKLGNVIFTYPFTTIRTRIQQNQYVKININQVKYNNSFEIIRKTFQKQGIRGFYKGISVNLLRGVPEKGIYFYTYQMFKKLLINQQTKH